MTVYEQILKQPDEIFTSIKCDLDSRRVWFKNELVFDDGKFLSNTTELPLIHLADGEEQPIVWAERIKQLYEAYAGCYPKRHRHLNFRCQDTQAADPIISSSRFDYARVSLELYVLFHGVQKDLIWSNPNHFFQHITKNCVVYRRWLI